VTGDCVASWGWLEGWVVTRKPELNVTGLPFIVCQPSKTDSRFRFPFAENKRKFAASVFRIYAYIEMAAYISRHIYLQ
jgi:hypothetical protein